MKDDKMVFNGIDGATGGYLLPPLSTHDLADLAKGRPLQLETDEVAGLGAHARRMKKASFRVAAGVDPRKIEQAGWAIIFPRLRGKGTLRGEDAAAHAQRQAAIREALAPLIEHRRAQASRVAEHRFKTLDYNIGAPNGEATLEETGPLRVETKTTFFGRQEPPVDGNAAVDPDKFPYYVLLVGSPEEIPYRFQYQLDVQYAVGRLHFDTVDEYARYAQSVVAAETSSLSLGRRMAMWGPCTRGDRATELSSAQLLTPLSQWLSGELLADPAFVEAHGTWTLDGADIGGGTKAKLGELLGGARTPAFLMTASHGLRYPEEHGWHRSHTGALLCQDWTLGQTPREDDLFAGDDLAADARVAGLVAFHFACYGAGLPGRDSFEVYEKGVTRKSDGAGGSAGAKRLAGQPFVARLPQRLLAHPKGGALAVIGHVDRAWGSSFFLSGRRSDAAQLAVFRSTLHSLLQGYPVGCAMDYFNERYAASTSDLANAISQYQEDGFSDEYEDEAWMAEQWLTSNDARNYAVIGDPAVRLCVGDEGGPSQVDLSAVPEVASAPAATPTYRAGASRGGPSGPPRPRDEADGPGGRVVNESFGWFGSDKKDEAQADEAPAAKGPGFLERIGDALARLASDLTSIEVTTYTSEQAAEAHRAGQKVEDFAQPRALTRIAFDGDVKAWVPTANGKIDAGLWKAHCDLVHEAQAHRARMLEALIGAVTGQFGGSNRGR
ncbi:MAG: hypothetical protein KC620_08855 [Myxococcales bacterium]|nr:hypothetical protein [Myxococcales bacterium]